MMFGPKLYPVGINNTRDNGVINAQYPILDRFNDVICHVKMGEDTYYLDASRPMLAFGKLPLDCYNGPVRIINHNYPYAPELKTDQVTEEPVTNISVTNSGQNEWMGRFQQIPVITNPIIYEGKSRKKVSPLFLKN